MNIIAKTNIFIFKEKFELGADSMHRDERRSSVKQRRRLAEMR